jgi:hypothetical protein
MILTMTHWSSGLPVGFPPQGSQVQIPWGDLCETRILLLALSRYKMLFGAPEKEKKNLPMIDTISKTSKIFNQWIDIISVKHD